MKKFLLLFVAVITTFSSINATVYYSQSSGATAVANFNTSRTGVGTTAVSGDLAVSGNIFIIQGTGGGLGAPHTVTSGSTITYGAGVTLEVEGGGTLVQNSNITFNSTATFKLDALAKYTHNSSGSAATVAGIENWDPTATITYTNTGFLPTANITGGAHPNVIIANTSNANISGVITNIAGSLTISAGAANTINLTGATALTLTIGGNLVLTTGTALSLGNGTASPVINLAGNLSIATGMTLTYAGSGTGAINFTKSGTQTYSTAGTGATSAAINYTVNSGSTLDVGTSIIAGTGTFNLSSGAGIITKNTAGLSTTAGTGSIQVTGTKTYNTGADYTYNGTAAQVLGNGFTGGRNLTLNNTSGSTPSVAMNTTFSLSGNLTLTTGDIRNTSSSAKTITMTGAAPTLAVGGAISGTNVGVGNDINLVYTNTSGTLTISGLGSLCKFLAVTNTNTGSTIAIARNLFIEFGTFTENGYFQINSGGSLTMSGTGSPLSPTYGASSTLVYNTGGSYAISSEWTSTGASAGIGIPKDIIVQNNTTITTTAARGLAGAIFVTSGSTFIAGGGTLAATGGALIDGTFQLNSGGFATGTFTYASTNSKLIFNAAYTVATGHAYFPASNGPAKVFVNVGTVDFGSVTRTIPDTFSVSATITNYCNLTLNGVTALNSGYNFSGTCGSGPFYACSSTLNYNSGGTPARGGEWGTGATPGNLSVSNNTTVNGNIGTGSICGNLTIASGSSLYMDFGSSGASALNVGGNVSIAGNLSLGFGVGGDMTVGGNWTHTTGTFATNSRAVSFTGATGNQTITNTAGETFAYLTINKALGNVVLANNVTVNNTLALTSGNISIASNILTLNGTVTRTSGNFIGSNTSSLVIGGTAGSLFFASGGTNNFLKALTLNSSATATLGNALNITAYDGANEGVLTITPGSAVLTTGGFLTMKSSSSGTSRIAAGNTAGGYISGTATIERYIPQNSVKSWRLLATNTTGSQSINAAWQEGQIGYNVNTNPGFGTMIAANGASIGAVQALGFDTLSYGGSIFKYDPATDNLVGIANTNSTVLSSEVGYFLFIRGDRGPNQFNTGVGATPTAPTSSTVLRSTGSLILGNQSAITTGAKNYALLRNPYPSRINLLNVVRSGSLMNAYQVWDPTLSTASGFGAYQTLTYNSVAGHYQSSTSSPAYGTAGSNHDFVESGSAFYIQSTGPANGSAQVLESSKETGSAVVNRPASATNRMYYSLTANNTNGANVVDGGYIDFDATYSNDVDIEDIRKSSNFGENFGIINLGTSIVVERRALLTTTDTIRFDMNSLRNITYTLDINPEAISALNLNAILEDKFLGTSTYISLLSPSQYSFTVNATAGSFAADRFRIVFKTQAPLPVNVTNIRAYAQTGTNVAVEWKAENQLNVDHYEIEKSVTSNVFTKVGTQIATGLNGSTVTYNWVDINAARGTNYYRIKIVDINGQSRYSAVATVNFGKVVPSIKILPNVIEGGNVNMVFTAQDKGNYQIRLINNIGQVMFNKLAIHAGGDATQTFNLPSQIAGGVYQLEVITPNNDRQVQKVIIK